MQQVLAARINEATVRLLTRLGCEVIVADGSGCCRALTHHLGREAEAYAAVKANVDAWTAEMEVARSEEGSMRLLSTHRVAAPPSRITALCCVPTTPMPTGLMK